MQFSFSGKVQVCFECNLSHFKRSKRQHRRANAETLHFNFFEKAFSFSLLFRIYCVRETKQLCNCTAALDHRFYFMVPLIMGGLIKACLQKEWLLNKSGSKQGSKTCRDGSKIPVTTNNTLVTCLTTSPHTHTHTYTYL